MEKVNKPYGFHPNNFTDEEKRIMYEYYPISTKEEMLELLPNRKCWNITIFASRNNICKTKETRARINSTHKKGKRSSDEAIERTRQTLIKLLDDPQRRLEYSRKQRHPNKEIKWQLRNSINYITWRNSVFNRDNKTCQECGNKHDLNAHHIKSFSSIIKENNIMEYEQGINCLALWDLSNGITLCNSCHNKLPGHYVPLFREGKRLKNIKSA